MNRLRAAAAAGKEAVGKAAEVRPLLARGRPSRPAPPRPAQQEGWGSLRGGAQSAHASVQGVKDKAGPLREKAEQELQKAQHEIKAKAEQLRPAMQLPRRSLASRSSCATRRPSTCAGTRT